MPPPEKVSRNNSSSELSLVPVFLPLYPESGLDTIEVNVVVPDEEDMEFTGEIKIINKNDNSDYELIQISLSTPKNRDVFRFRILQIFERFIERIMEIY